MPENQFDDLLRQWQEARATHEIGFGGGGFELHVIPTGQANGYHSSPACGYVGSIFLRDAADTCYHVFASFRSRGWEPSREAFDTFLELARRTGARLESPIRNHCGGLSQGSAEADWLACMWLHKPPPPAQFGQPLQWWSPFQAAIETLEKAGLVSGSQTGGNGESVTLPPKEDPPIWIPLTWLRDQVSKKRVGGDATKLGAWLKRRKVTVDKRANKLYVKQAELLSSGVFPKGSEVHRLIKEYNKA